jgi:hypothetical protein
MTKDDAIKHIEGLMPPDSRFHKTAEIGQILMLDALARHWHLLPEPVLVDMAQTMISNEERGAEICEG